nr:MAG TPA: hypothetical protein [Microviridae sp.]
MSGGNLSYHLKFGPPLVYKRTTHTPTVDEIFP